MRMFCFKDRYTQGDFGGCIVIPSSIELTEQISFLSDEDRYIELEYEGISIRVPRDLVYEIPSTCSSSGNAGRYLPEKHINYRFEPMPSVEEVEAIEARKIYKKHIIPAVASGVIILLGLSFAVVWFIVRCFGI